MTAAPLGDESTEGCFLNLEALPKTISPKCPLERELFVHRTVRSNSCKAILREPFRPFPHLEPLLSNRQIMTWAVNWMLSSRG